MEDLKVYIVMVAGKVVGLFRDKEKAKGLRLSLIKELGNSTAVKWIEWTITD